jgi:hypothetical protein
VKSSTPNRFATFGPDGELIALVADGLPEWPADPNALTDEQLAEYEAAALAEVQAIRDAVAADADHEFDVEHATQLTERIGIVRTLAAARMSAEGGEGEGGGDDDGGAGDPDPDPEARATALAALEGLDAPPAADPNAPGAVLEAQGVDVEAIARVAGEAAATATVTAMAPLVDSVTTGMREVAQAVRPSGTRGAPGRGLGAYAPESTDPANAPTDGQDPHPGRGTLVASADVPNMPMGTAFDGMRGTRGLVDAFIRRHNALGRSSGVEGERIPVGQFQLADHLPTTRDLRGITDGTELKRRVMEVMGPEALGINPWTGREAPIGRGGIIAPEGANVALTASGGLAAPVEPYYPQLVLAEAMRVVAGSMPSFVAERGGIRGVTPATIGALAAATPPGMFFDGVTDDNTSWVSATADFTVADVGKPIVNAVEGTGPLAAGTIINSVTNSTTVVLSQDTTGGSLTGQAFYLPARNPNNLGPAVGVVTAAQDAAGPPNTTKFTYDVPDGTQYEFDVYSVYTSLQFGNLTARTFPEQVEAAILLGNALAARTAEEQMLNTLTNYSTLFTGAKTFGTARQLLAQIDHMAAYYRNHNRMDPQAVLRLLLPAWALNAMRSDFISSFMGGGKAGLQGLSDEELGEFFSERNVLPGFYVDGPSDVGQLFTTPGSGAINTGSNTATPIAIPDYPGSGSGDSFRTEVVSYMWGEGTWLNLTTGELNLGLVRDSILNTQNKFRNFEEVWETPAFVGNETLRCVHTVAADGSYGAAVSVTLGAGSGL